MLGWRRSRPPRAALKSRMSLLCCLLLCLYSLLVCWSAAGLPLAPDTPGGDGPQSAQGGWSDSRVAPGQPARHVRAAQGMPPPLPSHHNRVLESLDSPLGLGDDPDPTGDGQGLGDARLKDLSGSIGKGFSLQSDAVSKTVAAPPADRSGGAEGAEKGVGQGESPLVIDPRTQGSSGEGRARDAFRNAVQESPSQLTPRLSRALQFSQTGDHSLPGQGHQVLDVPGRTAESHSSLRDEGDSSNKQGTDVQVGGGQGDSRSEKHSDRADSAFTKDIASVELQLGAGKDIVGNQRTLMVGPNSRTHVISDSLGERRDSGVNVDVQHPVSVSSDRHVSPDQNKGRQAENAVTASVADSSLGGHSASAVPSIHGDGNHGDSAIYVDDEDDSNPGNGSKRHGEDKSGLPGGSTLDGARRRLPQALIIGVKKAGTRALLEFLRAHPDVRAPGPEPHFFDKHYHLGLEWYRELMPPTLEGQLTIEKTPSYFITKEVPKRIYNMSKDVKLIVVVRDPVVRAISDYTQAASKRPDIPPFEQMAFVDNRTGLIDTSWGAIRIGVYAKHLERYLKYFPLDQMLFVSGERLITDPAGEMARVQDFLGLKRIITERNFSMNQTRGFPCLIKPLGNGRPHCLGKTKGRQHPHVDTYVLKRCRDFYRPFNAKFFQMVGEDFGWS